MNGCECKPALPRLRSLYSEPAIMPSTSWPTHRAHGRVTGSRLPIRFLRSAGWCRLRAGQPSRLGKNHTIRLYCIQRVHNSKTNSAQAWSSSRTTLYPKLSSVADCPKCGRGNVVSTVNVLPSAESVLPGPELIACDPFCILVEADDIPCIDRWRPPSIM
jgi:hypothetical protein